MAGEYIPLEEHGKQTQLRHEPGTRKSEERERILLSPSKTYFQWPKNLLLGPTCQRFHHPSHSAGHWAHWPWGDTQDPNCSKYEEEDFFSETIWHQVYYAGLSGTPALKEAGKSQARSIHGNTPVYSPSWAQLCAVSAQAPGMWMKNHPHDPSNSSPPSYSEHEPQKTHPTSVSCLNF